MPRAEAPAQPNQSLHNGLACLQQVVGAPQPIGCREVARRLRMTPTRANRLLGTLAQLGLLQQNARRKYEAGPGLHILAAQSMRASGLLAAALPSLRMLQEDGHIVALGVLWEGWVCYLFHERGGQNLEEALQHELYPGHYSSIGVALLAAGVESFDNLDPVEEFQRQIIPGFDPATAIAEAQREGTAVVRHRSGEVSVGVTVGDPPVAGIAVAGVMRPTAARLAAVRAALKRESAAITARLRSRR